MDRRPQGRAVIISNRFFLTKLEVRDGAEYDEENIRNLFIRLHFDVQLHCNKSADVCNVSENHIFGISDPTLPIRYTTFAIQLLWCYDDD